jgi:hypothetical protein
MNEQQQLHVMLRNIPPPRDSPPRQLSLTLVCLPLRSSFTASGGGSACENGVNGAKRLTIREADSC